MNNGPHPPIYVPHPLLRARDWQDRPEFHTLCDWWAGCAASVCALIGIGGAGKTAIMDRFLRTLPEALAPSPDIPIDGALTPPKSLFVFSFYDAPNPDDFFAQLADWLGAGPAHNSGLPVSYELTRMALAGAGDCLIVLDGLEEAQDTGVRGGTFGQILDGRLRDIVMRVSEGYLPHIRILITTRFRPFEPLVARSPLYSYIPVECLHEDAAVALLRRRGVERGTDDELKRIAQDHWFHALSVDLMGGYIARFCGGDPTQLTPYPADQPGAKDDPHLAPEIAAMQEQERKFARIAERYYEKLSDTDPAAIALLQRVCLFRLGVDTEMLVSIFTGRGKLPVSGSSLRKLNKKKLQAKLDFLTEMKLLERRGPESRAFGKRGSRRDGSATEESASQDVHSTTVGSPCYTVHPAVRDGFLATLDVKSVRRGHEAAREGLTKALPGRLKAKEVVFNLNISRGPLGIVYPRTSATLDLLEEIVYHTLKAGHMQEAFGIYWYRIGGVQNLAWRLGAYERGERICRAFALGGSPRAASLPEGLEESARAGLFNEWGIYLKYLGRLESSVHCYERMAVMAMRREEWTSASVANDNKSQVLLLAGRLKEGLAVAAEAHRLAGKGNSTMQTCNSLADRAHAHALRGDTDDALDDFRETLHSQHEASGKEPSLSALGGIYHALLLPRLGRGEEATRMTEANRELLLKTGGANDHEIPLCNLVLADLARERDDGDAALDLLAQAREWAIAHDAQEPLCWSALVRARLELSSATAQGTTPRAPGVREALSRARAATVDGLRIARHCGYGIHHIDLLLVRAQVALCEGDSAAASEDIYVALEGGVHPLEGSGSPTLLAANDQECGYAWGIAQGGHLRGEALLLQAAHAHRSAEFAPARFDGLSEECRSFINEAREELRQCCALRMRIQDCRVTDSERLLKRIDGGVLTDYPLTRIRREAPSTRMDDPERIPSMYEFNVKRLEQLEELLEIQYEKLHEYERELEMAGVDDRINIRQRIKRDITPRLRDREREYAGLLAAGTEEDSLREEDAEPIIAELVEATTDIDRYRNANAPADMLRLLNEISAKLNEPATSAAAKLKVALPIIPLLASYELELDTESFLGNLWSKARGLFKGIVSRN